MVELPRTLLYPGTQLDNTFKLKKVPADKRAYFSSLAHNFLARLGGTVARGPTTTGVALKRLKSRQNALRTHALNGVPPWKF